MDDMLVVTPARESLGGFWKCLRNFYDNRTLEDQHQQKTQVHIINQKILVWKQRHVREGELTIRISCHLVEMATNRCRSRVDR